MSVFSYNKRSSSAPSQRLTEDLTWTLQQTEALMGNVVLDGFVRIKTDKPAQVTQGGRKGDKLSSQSQHHQLWNMAVFPCTALTCEGCQPLSTCAAFYFEMRWLLCSRGQEEGAVRSEPSETRLRAWCVIMNFNIKSHQEMCLFTNPPHRSSSLI